jgi:hypothetical protein
MNPLFDMPTPLPETAQPRWLQLAVTLDASGRVVAVQTDAITVNGSRVASRAWFPTPGSLGHPEPLRALFRLADELTRDS